MKSPILLLASSFLLALSGGLRAQDSGGSDFAPLQAQYEKSQAAVLQKYCLKCHSTAEKQGELDLEQFHSVADLRGNVVPWQRVRHARDMKRVSLLARRQTRLQARKPVAGWRTKSASVVKSGGISSRADATCRAMADNS